MFSYLFYHRQNKFVYQFVYQLVLGPILSIKNACFGEYLKPQEETTRLFQYKAVLNQ